MKVVQSFSVEEHPAQVWEFFQQVDRVARCIPGVEDVVPLEDGKYKVRVTQKVGFISATFDLETTMGESVEGERLSFNAVGRTVRGAAGHIRMQNQVEFKPKEEGGTDITLTSEMALGGMLGSLGHKVIGGKAAEITKGFAAKLREEIARWVSTQS